MCAFEAEHYLSGNAQQNAGQRCRCPVCPWTQSTTSPLLEWKKKAADLLIIHSRTFFNSSKDGFLYLNEDNLINVVNMQMRCNYFSPPVVCGQIGGCPTTPPRRSSLMMLSCPFGSSELQHPFGWQGRHRSHTSWLRIWMTSKHHLWRHHQREGCHIVYDGTKRF